MLAEHFKGFDLLSRVPSGHRRTRASFAALSLLERIEECAEGATWLCV
jgi:hypothetical protein